MRSRLTRQTWGRRSKSVTLLTQAATTTVKTTTQHLGSSVDVGEYRSGIFMVAVTANSTGAPKMILEGSNNNTNWFDIKTLDNDLTTTANTSGTFVEVLPRYIRTKFTPYTTSISKLHVNVTGEVII